jgi:tetratricopeptide (TPR) repeat protein
MPDDWEGIRAIANALRDGKTSWVLRHAPGVLRQCQESDARATLLGCLAAAHQREGDWDKGLSSATEALQLDPSLSHVRACRAVCLLRTGNVHPAIADTDQMIAQDPRSALAYYLRSTCYLVLANNVEAPLKPIMLRRSLADIDEALYYCPDDPTYRGHRDTLHELVGQQVVAAERSINGWEIAGKIAKVAGQFVGGMLG